MKKLIITAMTFTVLMACSTQASEIPEGINQVQTIELNNQEFHLKVAITDNERQLGLMNIMEMPENEGMLFKFPESKPRSFWMKNTEIPLDIIFIDENQQIINIHYNTPPCKEKDPTQQKCPLYLSSKPAKYAIELNAGQSETLGLKPKQQLNL